MKSFLLSLTLLPVTAALAHQGHGIESQFHSHAGDIALAVLAVIAVLIAREFDNRRKDK
jgi:hypothetical protein